MAKRPPKIITLDTETFGLDGGLRRIAIYDGEAVTFGYSFRDVLWKSEQYYNDGFMPHIYIHNSDFDLRKIPEIFERGNVIWSRTKKIGTKYAKITCIHYVIHDSLKLLPFTLKKLSKDFGLEHGKLNLMDEVRQVHGNRYKDEEQFFNECDKDDPLYIKYLGYDVISLHELIYKLIEVSGIAEENIIGCLSTASMSKYVLKNGYHGEPFGDPEKTDYQILCSCPAWSSKKKLKFSSVSYEEIEYKMREGFYGGRTEVFTPVLPERIGGDGNREITGYHYDVNSLYPSVMIDNPFPVGFPEYEDSPRIIRLNWETWLRDKQGLGFIKAVVYIPPQQIPPLPVKLGKLAFVTGTVQGTWSYHELAYAVENCGVEIVQFMEQIHFKKTHKVFHNFVSVFYEMKARGKVEGNPSLTAFAKLMLNTAYGWTVLRRDDKTALRDISTLEKWKESEQFIYANEEYGFIEIYDKVMSDSIQVQIGAYVTSYARLVLLDALRHQSEIGTVYYCDTDSIVCSSPMKPEMVDPLALGKWDLESRLYSALFIQPKVYTESKVDEKDTIKFKGVSRKRQAEMDRAIYEELYELIRDGVDTKFLIEEGRKTLPSLAVAQKQHIDPNQFKVTDKTIDTGAKGKRNFDYVNNTSKAWHMETLHDFERFNFRKFDNPPEGKNLFGG